MTTVGSLWWRRSRRTVPETLKALRAAARWVCRSLVLTSTWPLTAELRM
jgi:hypothetical protein